MPTHHLKLKALQCKDLMPEDKKIELIYKRHFEIHRLYRPSSFLKNILHVILGSRVQNSLESSLYTDLRGLGTRKTK